ncbi:MAG: RNA 2',3'-cyclic phosphodiesterase [Conexivisphaerales archaeon]
MKLRIFVALELKDDSIRSSIAKVQERIMATGADLRKVEPSILHMTLKFIGEVQEKELVEIQSLLKQIKADSFEAKVEGVGAFPSMNRINVVWVGLKDADNKVLELHSLVNKALERWGEKEKNFHPHMTIFRVRSGKNVDKLKQTIKELSSFEFGRCRFDEFQLKKSVLTPAGPLYTNIEVYRMI